jgi:glycosyltransferase involved in cell wall biosynthesis
LYRKGLDVLVAAWRRLVEDGRQRRLLLLVGDGDDAEDLRVRLATLSGDVRWHDHYVTDRAHIRQHLAAADVAVLPSRHEGFPVALLEAMASGRAVVATDVSGVADVAPRGERDGVVIVAPGDPSGLAAGLSRVTSDGVLGPLSPDPG